MNADIKAIVFDVGGVLRDSSETFDFVFSKIFEESGLKYSFSTIDVWHLRGFRKWNGRKGALQALLCISRSGKDFSEIMKRRNAEEMIAGIIKNETRVGDTELIRKMAEKYVYWFYESPESRRYTKVMPHAIDSLKKLSEMYALAALTDSRLSLTEKWFEDLGIKKYFKVIAGEEQLKNKKPDPEGLLLVAEKLGVAPAEMLYVGDSAHDIVAAHNAGCKSAAVLTGMGMRYVLEAEKPDHVFDNLAELTKYFSDI